MHIKYQLIIKKNLNSNRIAEKLKDMEKIISERRYA